MAEKKRKKQKQDSPEMTKTFSEDEGKILVRICGREKGLEEYEKVSFVRVISKGYNLLIMADYLPIIGQLEGSIFFRTGKEEYGREHLKGYFMHKNNQFSLMLESEGKEKETEVETEAAEADK